MIATYLTKHYGFVELAFATKMKQVAEELFPRIKYEKDRWLLIQVGERLRELDSDVWIKYLLPSIPMDKDCVVSDVRFPKEYETLRRLGFTMVRMYVSRGEQEAMVRKMYPTMPMILLDDYSETALDYYPFDVTIDNDVSLEEVYEQADIMMKELRGGR